MVGVDSGSLCRRTRSISHLAWSLVLARRPLDAVLHSSHEPGEFSQLCHDDSTINIVVLIIIIIIIIIELIQHSPIMHTTACIAQ